jgi:hypothetical protein
VCDLWTNEDQGNIEKFISLVFEFVVVGGADVLQLLPELEVVGETHFVLDCELLQPLVL